MSKKHSSSTSRRLYTWTACIGLPTARAPSNRSPFTIVKPFERIVGITRSFNMRHSLRDESQFDEVAQQTAPDCLAFLGMELRSKHVFSCDDRRELAAVGRSRHHVTVVHTLHVETVDKVEVGAVRDTGK